MCAAAAGRGRRESITAGRPSPPPSPGFAAVQVTLVRKGQAAPVVLEPRFKVPFPEAAAKAAAEAEAAAAEALATAVEMATFGHSAVAISEQGVTLDADAGWEQEQVSAVTPGGAEAVAVPLVEVEELGNMWSALQLEPALPAVIKAGEPVAATPPPAEPKAEMTTKEARVRLLKKGLVV